MDTPKTEELSQNELDSIKAELKKLQSKVAEQEKLLKQKSNPRVRIWDLVETDIIDGIEMIEDVPQFVNPYTQCRATIATYLISIARLIHKGTGVYVERDKNSGHYSKDYHFDNRAENIPLLKELTEEQLLQSAQLINEIIKLFNAEYVKNHPSVKVKWNDCPEIEELKIGEKRKAPHEKEKL